MSEQNNGNITPAIEDAINKYLTGEMQQNALEYVAYMNAHDIALPETGQLFDDYGAIQYTFDSHNILGCVCHVLIVHRNQNQNNLEISLGSSDSNRCVIIRNEYQDFPIDEEVKRFAWDNVRICQNFKTNGNECGCGSQPGKRIALFGKEIANVCTALFDIRNPNGKALELTKRLTDVLIQSQSDAKADFSF